MLNTLVWTQAVVGALWVAAEAWTARRTRKEPDGGETRLVEEPPAVVSTSETNGAPIEAHVQVTRACGLPCPTCYVDPDAAGDHVPLTTLRERFESLAARGVFRVALGGGEVLRHPDLAAMPALARAAGLTIGATTSGLGPLEALHAFDQVNVSFDGDGALYARTRGYDGADAALGAIRSLAARGVRVGVNVVLDRETFPALAETVRAAVEAGARDVQLLRLKPAGRAAAVYAERRLTAEQGLALWPVAQTLLEEHPGVTFRIDCALVPFLAAHDVDPQRMTRFGILGCHGGDALLSVDPTGGEHPCSFETGPVDPAWREGVTEGACASCPWRAVCRGGCHVVARHVTGRAFAPDPECPRVLGG